MSTPRLRTPGRGLGAASPHGAGVTAKNSKTMPVPTLPYSEIPKYTQEELDSDVCHPDFWTYYYERAIVFASFVSMIVYMVWRWRCFLTRPSTLWISLPLILSETTLVFPGLFISYFMILHRIKRPLKRLKDMKLPEAELPAVDVFIPCLNEPVDIVRDTLVAASNMNYPKSKLTVCVCDDGRRAEIKNMVESVQDECRARRSDVNIKYIAREKIPGVPHHAKAGNLNNAILGKESSKEGAARNTTGQFLVIFDCDMVCEPHFLEALLPHFYYRTESGYKVDENIALVQSPQSFIGVPINDPLGQQYRYFYGPVLQGWDGADSAPCCGTNVIFQRKCMEAIGGFVYGSVTEDFLTSMYLHDAGFRSKYVHEYLARGLSPDSLNDFMKQRLRWAAGAVEIFFKHNSIYRPGLTWKQTYLYFWAGLQALLGFPSLLVCITPFVSLIDNRIQVAPMNASQYTYFMGTFMFFTVWMLIISYREVPKLYLMRSVQESVFMLFCKMQAVFQVALQGNVKFVTTKKDAIKQSPIRQDLGHIFPHLMYYLFSMAAAALVVYNFIEGLTPREKLAGQGICFIWIAVVMWQLWPPIGVVIGEILSSMRSSGHEASPVADPKAAGIATVTPRLPENP